MGRCPKDRGDGRWREAPEGYTVTFYNTIYILRSGLQFMTILTLTGQNKISSIKKRDAQR
jgi:hypothetical protein